MTSNVVTILGINFSTNSVEEIYNELYEGGGLLVVPSAPVLVNAYRDKKLYNALLRADKALPDSGYMSLIWNIISKHKVTRCSGLKFINYFIKAAKTNDKTIFLVNPNDIESEANYGYFKKLNLKVGLDKIYIAPIYNTNILDYDLLEKIEVEKPHWIFLNIGGGVQEILGDFLKDNLSYKPAIICTGAAIAFKTGYQVNIPNWADYLYLGWLFRIFFEPTKYLKRYWLSLSLLPLLYKFKSNKML